MSTQFWSGFSVAVLALVAASAYAYLVNTVINDRTPPAVDAPIVEGPPVTEGPYSAAPEESAAKESGGITIAGTIVCLPKVGPGPHTMECAYGLRADTGGHYVLYNLFDGPWPWHFNVGDRVRIEGVLLPPPTGTTYDIIGAIAVESSKRL